MTLSINKLPFLILIIFSFFSCAGEKRVQFGVYGTGSVLLAKSSASQEGLLDFSAPKKLEYRFDDIFSVPHNSSLQIHYEFSFPLPQGIRDNFSLVLRTGSVSWELPVDFEGVCFYSIPVDDSFDGQFSISLEPPTSPNGRSFQAPNEKTGMNPAPVFRIRSISFTERFFGFSNTDPGIFISTPFVYRQESDPGFVIDVPSSFWPAPLFVGVNASFNGEAVLELAGRRYETLPGTGSIVFSPSVFSAGGNAALTGTDIKSFYINARNEPAAFPRPIVADPALVIEWPRESWRNTRYEVFSWDRLETRPLRQPPVLIFDYADYRVQDRMLKRLAFFVEKAGFRGRMMQDHEIAHLHGWNAHDYRAEDLARFFDTARKTNFPLLEEERELERILLNEEIIRETPNGIVAGNGAIISISRESTDSLRYRFMAHEGFHGLFFIDEDFREFSRQRWEQFSAEAKRFLIGFFMLQQYDVEDEYLLVNEFMAHVLQQSVSQAADYFGRQLPLRLEPTIYASWLPQKNAASGTWPSLAAAFTSEAQAFSAYVNRRWGLAAGRVWGLRIR